MPDIADAAVAAALFPVVAAEFARRHGPSPGGARWCWAWFARGAAVERGLTSDLIVIMTRPGRTVRTVRKPLATRFITRG